MTNLTPAERLFTAIGKLGSLLDESSPGPWVPFRQYLPGRGDQYGIENEQRDVVRILTDKASDAELIGVLHRTVVSQQRLLQAVLDARLVERDWESLVYTEAALSLADAILGLDS